VCVKGLGVCRARALNGNGEHRTSRRTVEPCGPCERRGERETPLGSARLAESRNRLDEHRTQDGGLEAPPFVGWCPPGPPSAPKRGALLRHAYVAARNRETQDRAMGQRRCVRRGERGQRAAWAEQPVRARSTSDRRALDSGRMLACAIHSAMLIVMLVLLVRSATRVLLAHAAIETTAAAKHATARHGHRHDENQDCPGPGHADDSTPAGRQRRRCRCRP